MLLTQHTPDTLRRRENIQSNTAITNQVEINFASFAQEYLATPTDILGCHSWRKAASSFYKTPFTALENFTTKNYPACLCYGFCEETS